MRVCNYICAIIFNADESLMSIPCLSQGLFFYDNTDYLNPKLIA